MKEEFIILEKPKNLLTINIKDENGIETGEKLEFNLKDIELLEKLQKMRDDSKKNYQWFNNQLVIIDKKQDFTKKGDIMSNNEKLKYNALKKYCENQQQVYDIFLGKDGVKKLLYNRTLEWESLKTIDKIIEEQIVPKLNITMDNIIDEIKEKYKKDVKESVLK